MYNKNKLVLKINLLHTHYVEEKSKLNKERGGNKLRNTGKRKESRIKQVLLSYVKNNARELSIVTIIFLIGLIFGVIFVNNAEQAQTQEISSYINGFINNLKDNLQINKVELLQESLISNFILALILWFVGSTVIGIPIVYGIIIYRGFCLGYTISSSVATLGIRKRNNILCYISIITKHYIYPMHISACS